MAANTNNNNNYIHDITQVLVYISKLPELLKLLTTKTYL